MIKSAHSAVTVLLFLVCAVGAALADDVRPAYLGVEATDADRFSITWKNPLVSGSTLPIEPVFPEGFKRISPLTTIKTSDAIIYKWSMSLDGESPEGQEITIAGLPSTTSDVLFRLKFVDGGIFRSVIKPNAPTVTIPLSDVADEPTESAVTRALRQIDSRRLWVLLVVVGVLGALPASRRRGLIWCAAALIVGSSFGYVAGQVPVGQYLAGGSLPSEEKAGRILHGLLLNVYRSFGYGQYEAVYDQMAKSVSGELLSDVYLQARNAMQIEEEEKAQTYVDRLDVREVDSMSAADDGGFTVIASWDVYGSVNHWEHIHYRCVAYRARLTLMPADGYWKITGFELLDENRVM